MNKKGILFILRLSLHILRLIIELGEEVLKESRTLCLSKVHDEVWSLSTNFVCMLTSYICSDIIGLLSFFLFDEVDFVALEEMTAGDQYFLVVSSILK